MTINGQPNDARLFLGFLKAPSVQLSTIEELKALDAAGVNPIQWPAEALARLNLVPGDASCRALVRQYLYLHAREAADSSDVAAALESVLACATDLPPDSRRMYFAEAAFLQDATAKSGALARAWFEDARKVKSALPEEDWESYPLAAIALAEGKSDECRAHLVRAIAALDRRRGNSGSAAAARARLAAILSA